MAGRSRKPAISLGSSHGLRLLGKNFTPPDVHAKVTGKAKYAEDFRVDGMVFVKVLTSPMPHARHERRRERRAGDAGRARRAQADDVERRRRRKRRS